MRSRVLVATKCGIRPAGEPQPGSPARYDFSAQHILDSCDQSLKRLGIDTIDIFMLHRPDYLADPEEIAEAFSQLKVAGKVRCFGVSNFRPTLVTALKPPAPCRWWCTRSKSASPTCDAFTDGTLDQCLIENITPMAWSPSGRWPYRRRRERTPAFPESLSHRETPARAGRHRPRARRQPHGGRSGLALKHPGKILPIIGSTNPERIREAAKAPELELTREEWYRLLLAARGEPLP